MLTNPLIDPDKLNKRYEIIQNLLTMENTTYRYQIDEMQLKNNKYDIEGYVKITIKNIATL